MPCMKPVFARRLVATTLVLTATAGAAAQTTRAVAGPAEGLRLSYTITLRPEYAPALVDVNARIDAVSPDASELRLTMNRGFAFVRLPEPLLAQPVRAMAGKQPLTVERLEPYVWSVKTEGHARIELQYSVPLKHRELEAVKGRHEYEYPFAAADHALLLSATMIVYPDKSVPSQIAVDVIVPEGWLVCTPWPQLPGGKYQPPTLAALTNDLVAVGKWSTHAIHVGDFAGTIALVPGLEEIEKDVADVISRIVEHELKLFGRPPEGRYLFLFGPPVKGSMAGSPKTSSMVLAVDPQLRSQGVYRLAHLIAHEFYHTWHRAETEMPDELRWLSEGITDYYAYLVSARLGLLTWEQFADTLAEKMQQAGDNRHFGQMSLVQAGGPAFFRDESANELVYDGGLLVGAWLDCAIRAEKKGQSLDDLMRAFMNDPRWGRPSSTPGLNELIALLPRFMSAESVGRIEAAVREPYRLDPVETFGRLGVTVTRQAGPVEPDFRANLDGTRIIDLDHNGCAYRFGLRENDRLIEVNGQKVASAGEVRAAFRTPRDGRFRASVLRGDQTLEIDEPLPETIRYRVPTDPWRACDAGAP
jgi:predicted metalloprotease with PDZ domain